LRRSAFEGLMLRNSWTDDENWFSANLEDSSSVKSDEMEVSVLNARSKNIGYRQLDFPPKNPSNELK
jgi:hypothetical protein